MSKIIKKVDRVAFAVADLEKAREFFEGVLGAEFGPVEDIREFQFRCQPFDLAGYRMELLSPYDPQSVLSHFLMKEQQGFHHITCEVADLGEAIRSLQTKGVEVTPRHLYEESLEGQRWEGAFIDPRHSFGVLIHIVQKSKP